MSYRRRLCLLVLVFLGVFLSFSMTHAQDRYSLMGPSNYFAVKAGIFSPQSDDLKDFDEGFNGEIAFGHYFNRHLAMEVGLGYFRTEASFSGTIPGYGAYSEKDKLSVVPVTLSVKGILPIDKLELYAIGGIGLYFINGKADASVQRLGSISLEDDEVSFGVHLGAGMKFNITKEVFLGIEGKYIWTKADFETTYAGYRVNLDVDIEGFLVTGMIGFRF